MSKPDACLFCRIVDGDIPAKTVFTDDDVIAFHDINPQAPTHIVLIPRKHISTLDALVDDDRTLIGTIVLRASEIARSAGLNESGYRLVVNCGEQAGQTVFHIHFHILGGRRMSWPPG